jgi:hypothetical protein
MSDLAAPQQNLLLYKPTHLLLQSITQSSRPHIFKTTTLATASASEPKSHTKLRSQTQLRPQTPPPTMYRPVINVCPGPCQLQFPIPPDELQEYSPDELRALHGDLNICVRAGHWGPLYGHRRADMINTQGWAERILRERSGTQRGSTSVQRETTYSTGAQGQTSGAQQESSRAQQGSSEAQQDSSGTQLQSMGTQRESVGAQQVRMRPQRRNYGIPYGPPCGSRRGLGLRPIEYESDSSDGSLEW